MKSLSKSRRRLLISLGLLGVAGVFYRPGYKFLEVRRMTRVWEEKWQKSSTVQHHPGSRPAPENASRVPALIENDLTLEKAGSPWLVDDNVMIPEGVTLTVEAGSEVFIGRETYITVQGRILARGEAGSPVRFRAYSSSEDDKWAGIFVIQTAMPSVFQHVEFDNSYYGVRLVHAAGTWESCSFKNVREICSAFKSKTVFNGCLIDYKNYPGSGNINVFKFHKGTVQMENCTVYCPDSDYKVDGIDADYLVKGIFRGNRMYGGICPGADAIDVGRGSRNIQIENNIITDFVDKGISVGEGAEVVINNNIIARCAMGVGVKDSAHAQITRTTFHGNDFAIKCYEKVSGRGGGHASLNGCIIAGSKKAPFAVDGKSSISFTSTLCDQQLLPGKGNVQGTPEFEDTGRDRFNCTGITRDGGTFGSCHLSGAAVGASISPYPGELPEIEHE